MRTIGQNIRYYRKLRGYSQEKLAEMADINDKLTGKRIPTVINLVAIAEALEVTMDELCGINLSEPRIELEREIMRAVRGVLREYSKNSGNQMFNRKEKSVEKDIYRWKCRNNWT